MTEARPDQTPDPSGLPTGSAGQRPGIARPTWTSEGAPAFLGERRPPKAPPPPRAGPEDTQTHTRSHITPSPSLSLRHTCQLAAAGENIAERPACGRAAAQTWAPPHYHLRVRGRSAGSWRASPLSSVRGVGATSLSGDSAHTARGCTRHPGTRGTLSPSGAGPRFRRARGLPGRPPPPGPQTPLLLQGPTDAPQHTPHALLWPLSPTTLT